MVAPSECSMKSNIFSGKKVSKPLMEKKRRARINRCLDQLKTLLENYYTNNIRKRKLEKADILELTVKHLRNLQRNHDGASVNAKFAEFQAGYRSCLTGVNKYLMMTDNSSGTTRLNLLSHISSNFRSAEGATPGSRTQDSDTDQGEPGTATQTSLLKTAGHSSSSAIANVCHQLSAKTPLNSSVNVFSVQMPSERAKGDGEQIKGQCYSGDSSRTFRDNRFSTGYSPRNRCLTDGQYNYEFVGVISQNYWRPW